MKTLREHLLERSREAAPERELAAMRERVRAGLEQTRARAGGGAAGPLDVLRGAWRELIWPCRGLWSGLAAAWVVVLVLNHASRPAGGEPSIPSSEIVALHGLWREQQDLLAALARSPGPASAQAGRGTADPSAPEHRRSEPGEAPSKPLGSWREPGEAAGEGILT